MRYTTLLFDLDHTLLDGHASELAAFDSALSAAGVEDPRRHLDRYSQINLALWAGVERNEITPDDVRVTRFARLAEEAGIDADPEQMADDFVASMASNAELYPDAVAVLEVLADRATLALVTNGLSEVQRPRVERLDIGKYFDAIVISGEVGTAKPGTAIFDIVFAELGWPSKATTLMIGDSLSSDIQGGINYRIATCWYNPRGRALPAGTVVDHQIAVLSDLPVLVGNGSARS